MDNDFLLFMAVGFVAQLVDGALGMAYGVTSTTFLLSLGILPAAASASVHCAEVFTTGASGLCHLQQKNIDLGLFKRLLLPGILGAVLGAALLTALPLWPLRFGMALYLAIMGGLILVKAWSKNHDQRRPGEKLASLGFLGGFFDAMGGGGWGPIVTSTLVARGCNPRFTIGSVNLAEFFVALAVSLTFFLTIGLGYWPIVLGLIFGGILAAPLAAWVCRHLPSRLLMLVLGVLIILLSLRSLAQLLE